jgi:hypothetical protein
VDQPVGVLFLDAVQDRDHRARLRACGQVLGVAGS